MLLGWGGERGHGVSSQCSVSSHMGSNEKGPIDSDLQREGKGPPKLRFGNMHEKGHRSSDYGTCCEESKSFSEKFGIGPPHVGDSVMGGPEGFRPPRRAPGGFAPRGRQTAAAQTLPWGKTISPGVPEGRGVPEGPGGSQEGRQAVPVGPGPPAPVRCPRDDGDASMHPRRHWGRPGQGLGSGG